MLGCPAVLLFLSRSACLRVAAGMICPVKGRDAPPAYQRRCNGCSLGAGQRLRRLGHGLTLAFRFAAPIGRRCWGAAAGMICLVKERYAPPAYQHRGDGCSLVPDSGCAAWATI